VSQRRACGLIGIGPSSLHYRTRKASDEDLAERLRTLAARWRRFGYRRLSIMLRREGLVVNHKRVHRVYCAAGLQVRRRRRKHVPMPRGSSQIPVTTINQRWSMDFVTDRLGTGQNLRALTVMDEFSRVCHAIEVDTSLTGERVVRVLEQLALSHGLPQSLLSDNGPEFTSRAVLTWASRRQINLQFIEPGKPTQNAFIEAFNGRFRDECLSENAFTNLAEARLLIERWREEYNTVRPHGALHGQTPEAFARQLLNSLSPELVLAEALQ
jgi:putative transposase